MAKKFRRGMSLFLALMLCLTQFITPVIALEEGEGSSEPTVTVTVTDKENGDQEIVIKEEAPEGEGTKKTETTITASGDVNKGKVEDNKVTEQPSVKEGKEGSVTTVTKTENPEVVSPEVDAVRPSEAVNPDTGLPETVEVAGKEQTVTTSGSVATDKVINSVGTSVPVETTVGSSTFADDEIGDQDGDTIYTPGPDADDWTESEVSGWSVDEEKWEEQLEASQPQSQIQFENKGDMTPVEGEASVPTTTTEENVVVDILPEQYTTPSGETVEKTDVSLTFDPTTETKVNVPDGMKDKDDEGIVDGDSLLDAAEGGTHLHNHPNNNKQPFDKMTITVIIDNETYTFRDDGSGSWTIDGLKELNIPDGGERKVTIFWEDEDGQHQALAALTHHGNANKGNGNNVNATNGQDNYKFTGILEYKTTDIISKGDTDGYTREITKEDVVPEEYWDIATPIVDVNGNTIGWEVKIEPNTPAVTTGKESDITQSGETKKDASTEQITNAAKEAELNNAELQPVEEDGKVVKKVATYTDPDTNTVYVKTVTPMLDADGNPITDENGEVVFGDPVYTTTVTTTKIDTEAGEELTEDELKKLLNIEPDDTTGVTSYDPPAEPDVSTMDTKDADNNSLTYTYTPTYKPGTTEVDYYTLVTTATGEDGVVAYTYTEKIYGTNTTTYTYTVIDELTQTATKYIKRTKQVVTDSIYTKTVETAEKTWQKDVEMVKTDSIVHTYMAEGTDKTKDNGVQQFEFNGEMFAVAELKEDADVSAITNAGITLVNKATETKEGKTVSKKTTVDGKAEQVYNAEVTIEIKNSFIGDSKIAILHDEAGREIGRFRLDTSRKLGDGLTGTVLATPSTVDGNTVYTLKDLELTNGVRFTVSLTEPQEGTYTVAGSKVGNVVNVAAVNGAELAFDMDFTAKAPEYTHTVTTTTSKYSQHMEGKETFERERQDMQVKSVETNYKAEKTVIEISGSYYSVENEESSQLTTWEKVLTLFRKNQDTNVPSGTTTEPDGTTTEPDGTTTAPEETTTAPTEEETTAPTEEETTAPEEETTVPEDNGGEEDEDEEEEEEDDNDPDGGVPALVNIFDEGTPLDPEPMDAPPVPAEEPPVVDGVVTILDEEVPLADAPATGDMTLVWGAMGLLSLGGSNLLSKKKKDEDEEA